MNLLIRYGIMAQAAGIPNGSTATPVDDYTIWLACAELPDTFGSLAAVIASTTARTTLCNNKNALRYMVRSTSTIMPAVLANAGWVTALKSSTYAVSIPTMTNDTTPSGQSSASAVYTTNYAWKAFDKDSTTTFWSCSGTTGVLYYDFLNKTIYPFEFDFKVDAQTGSTSWTKILDVGGYDGATWDTLIASATYQTQTDIVVKVPVSKAYGKFRWNFTGGNTGSSVYCTVMEANIYGLNLA